jgi:hypothetical protein
MTRHRNLVIDALDWTEIAKDSAEPCIKCGARVAEMVTLGGVLEAHRIVRECRRCRHNQKPERVST